MKIALFFVCALVAIQGFQARSVEPVQTRGLSDVINNILETISRLLEMINNITAQIPEIVDNIVNRIREVIEQIQAIVGNINQAIEDLIQQGEIARDCVEAEREQINSLIDFANQGMQNCVSVAQAETDDLRDQLNVLVSRVRALREDIIERAAQCAEDSNWNPITLLRCLREQVEPVQEQVALLQAEVETTLTVARETAINATNTLVECSVELQGDIAERQSQLLDDIRQCIANNQPTTTARIE